MRKTVCNTINKIVINNYKEKINKLIAHTFSTLRFYFHVAFLNKIYEYGYINIISLILKSIYFYNFMLQRL